MAEVMTIINCELSTRYPVLSFLASSLRRPKKLEGKNSRQLIKSYGKAIFLSFGTKEAAKLQQVDFLTCSVLLPRCFLPCKGESGLVIYLIILILL